MKKQKYSKEYYKMLKSYRKKLIKNAKDTRPWDYRWLLDSLVLNLKFMRDYYKLNENVWGIDNTLLTRLESLNYVLSLYDMWQNCEDKFYKYHPSGGINNGEGIDVDGVKQDWWIEELFPNKEENRKAFVKEYKENKILFFKAIGKYIEEWWD